MSIDSDAASSFDVESKGRDWHTAFYYLAEHVRFLSHGTINHKELYALVGTEGRFINHGNPIVRKRTAGALSRIVHSRRYVQDMCACYLQDGLAFVHAAEQVCGRIRSLAPCTEVELSEYLKRRCWSDVRRGLENERAEWRASLDLAKIDSEMGALCAKAPCARDDEFLFASILRLIAFGGLEIAVSRALVDEYPTEALDAGVSNAGDVEGACLVLFSDERHLAMLGSWAVTRDRPFTIGRYIDCDIVRSDKRLSRKHGCVYRKGGLWYFEDLGSRNGSVVERCCGVDGGGGGSSRDAVYKSLRDGARFPVPLRFGDSIVLAGCEHLWFGAQV